MNLEYQTLFDQAVQLQSEGQLDAALDRYKQIKSNAVTSSALELNEALIYSEKEDWGRALTRVANAQKIARRPWLATELQKKIEAKVSSGRGSISAGIWTPVWGSQDIIHSGESLFLSAMMLSFFTIQLARGKRNKFAFTFLTLFILFVLLAGIQTLAPKEGFILSEGELKTLPLPSSPVKVSLAKGTHVIIEKCTNDYCKVDRPGDVTGWVSSALLKDPDESATKP